jgi:hypothetical protein
MGHDTHLRLGQEHRDSTVTHHFPSTATSAATTSMLPYCVTADSATSATITVTTSVTSFCTVVDQVPVVQFSAGLIA